MKAVFFWALLKKCHVRSKGRIILLRHCYSRALARESLYHRDKGIPGLAPENDNDGSTNLLLSILKRAKLQSGLRPRNDSSKHAPRITERWLLPPLYARLIIITFGLTLWSRAPLASDQEEGTVELPKHELHVRSDSQYQLGATSDQGFSLPSLRIIYQGQISEKIQLRGSVGLTKEYDSALLNQLMPIESFATYRGDLPSGSQIVVEAGLKQPAGFLFYSKDLSLVPFPNYLDSYRSVYPAPDLGIEFSLLSSKHDRQMGMGFYNGTGLTLSNLNQSKMVSLFLTTATDLGDVKLELGVTPYFLGQSNEGSLNFRQRWLVMTYATLRSEKTGWLLGTELWRGQFKDYNTEKNPTGGSLFGVLPIVSSYDLFARLESMVGQPGEVSEFTHMQMGFNFKYENAIQLFHYLDYLDYYSLGKVYSVQFRLRFFL